MRLKGSLKNISSLLFLILFSLLLGKVALSCSTDILFRALNSPWKLERTVRLKFRTYHPQGLYKLGDKFFLSSVEVIKIPQEGIGHLFVIDSKGNLLEDVKVGQGTIFHPGGIDFDGKRLWIPVAEYKPKGRSIIYKYDPKTSKLEAAFTFNDHIGALAILKERIIGFSWGSREYYIWDKRGKLLKSGKTPFRFVEFQDAKNINGRFIFLSGIGKLQFSQNSLKLTLTLGGITLTDSNLVPIISKPVEILSPKGRVITWNPSYIEVGSCSPEDIRLYFAPDDEETDILIFRPEL